MYTDPQILDDTTLSLDMTAGHRHFMHWYHPYTDTVSSLDMILHYTLTTVITCTLTEILPGLLLHIYVPLVHGYTNARTTAFQIIVIIVTGSLGMSQLHMHVWFLYSCHMDPRAYYMYYCSMLSPYSCYMIISRSDIDIPVTGHMSCWYAMCGIPHLLFLFPVIVFCAINRAHVMLSCYMYHILYLFLIYCIVKDNKENLGMGET